MLILHGIVNCDSCRNARRWLDAHELEYEFHDLRADGITVQMLERWCDRVDWRKILNKRSLTWRKVPERAKKKLSRSKALALILEHPTLVRRPVLETKEVTAVGFSEDGYCQIFRNA